MIYTPSKGLSFASPLTPRLRHPCLVQCPAMICKQFTNPFFYRIMLQWSAKPIAQQSWLLYELRRTLMSGLGELICYYTSRFSFCSSKTQVICIMNFLHTSEKFPIADHQITFDGFNLISLYPLYFWFQLKPWHCFKFIRTKRANQLLELLRRSSWF